MSKLDLVPSYIKIFDKYDNCRRFLNNPVGKSSEELNGYHAVAILCYDIANKTHSDIRKYLNPGIKKFFESLRTRLGGNDKINEYAKRYYEREWSIIVKILIPVISFILIIILLEPPLKCLVSINYLFCQQWKKQLYLIIVLLRLSILYF